MEADDNKWFLKEIKGHSWPIFMACLTVFVSNSLQIFTSLFVMVVYNKVIPNSAMNTLVALAVGVGVLLVFDYLFKIVKTRIVDDICARIERSLGPQLYQKILSWDIQDSPKTVGQSAALVRDLDNIIDLFTNSTITTLVSFPFVFINLFVIFLVGGNLVFVCLVACLLIFFTSFLGYKRNQLLVDEQKQKSVEKNSVFLETLTNLETLKSIGDYSKFEDRWQKAADGSRDLTSKMKGISNDTSSLNSFWVALTQVAIVSAGAYLVSAGNLSSGALIACVLLNGKAIQPIVQIATILQRIGTATVSHARLTKVFSKKSKEEQRRENIRLKTLNERIQLSSIEFKPEQSPSAIVSIKRLRIDYGEHIGILGSVGSGKSTLLKLLAGIYTPSEGQILFGNYDISAINQSDLRRNVAYVGQHPGIFGGSVRENLQVSDEKLADEKIVSISETSGLTEVLKGLPNGLEFKLSENGKELSGGQRQILALARAFSTDPSYMLLDEPTSAMDPRSERLFVARMKEYTDGKTLVVVTHRKPILALVSRVLVVERGQIVMDGTRDEVLKKISS